MADPLTEPFEPYQPEPAYDWEYDEEPRYAQRHPDAECAVGSCRDPRRDDPLRILARTDDEVLRCSRIGTRSRQRRGRRGAGRPRHGQRPDRSRCKRRSRTFRTQRLRRTRPRIPLQRTKQEDPAATDTTTEETYVIKSGETLSILAERFYGDASSVRLPRRGERHRRSDRHQPGARDHHSRSSRIRSNGTKKGRSFDRPFLFAAPRGA